MGDGVDLQNISPLNLDAISEFFYLLVPKFKTAATFWRTNNGTIRFEQTFTVSNISLIWGRYGVGVSPDGAFGHRNINSFNFGAIFEFFGFFYTLEQNFKSPAIFLVFL